MVIFLFNSPEPKAHAVSLLDGTPASTSVWVRPCVNIFKHKYLLDQQADQNQISSVQSIIRLAERLQNV